MYLPVLVLSEFLCLSLSFPKHIDTPSSTLRLQESHYRSELQAGGPMFTVVRGLSLCWRLRGAWGDEYVGMGGAIEMEMVTLRSLSLTSCLCCWSDEQFHTQQINPWVSFIKWLIISGAENGAGWVTLKLNTYCWGLFKSLTLPKSNITTLAFRNSIVSIIWNHNTNNTSLWCFVFVLFSIVFFWFFLVLLL